MKPCLLITALVLVLAPTGMAKPKPAPKLIGSVRIVFSGTAQQTSNDVQRYVFFSDNSCYQRETIAEHAQMSWSATWPKVKVAALRSLSSLVPTTPDPAAAVTGTDVKDGCDTPAKTPPEWFASTECRATLLAADEGVAAATAGKERWTLALAAPRLSLPAKSTCSLNVRNAELRTHVVVTKARLAALKKGRSLVVRVGTSRPGPGDYYLPAFNCSRPPKPYDGYQVFDRCSDHLTWSGTVSFTRV